MMDWEKLGANAFKQGKSLIDALKDICEYDPEGFEFDRFKNGYYKAASDSK